MNLYKILAILISVILIGCAPFNADMAKDDSQLPTVAQAQEIVLAHSGSWYNPRTSGQGFYIEVAPTQNKIVVYWFTYSRAGQGPSELVYYVGSGEIDNNIAMFDLYKTSEGEFNDEAPVTKQVVASGQLRFSDLNHGSFEFSSVELGSGVIPIERIGAVDHSIPDNPSPGVNHHEDGTTERIQAGLSGSWYKTSTSGQGFGIDVISATNQVVVYWFTFDPSVPGKQTWFIAQSEYENGDGQANFKVYKTSNGAFNSDTGYDIEEVGSAVLEVKSCTNLKWNYNIDDGLTGKIDLTRLTPNVFCTNEVPKVSPEPEVCTDSSNALIKDWENVFGAAYPDPIHRRADWYHIPREGYAAVRFRTTAEQYLYSVVHIQDTAASGVSELAISDTPGDFDVSPECKKLFGLGGAVRFSVNKYKEGYCNLEPNTTYYINSRFTDTPRGVCSWDCRYNCSRYLQISRGQD